MALTVDNGADTADAVSTSDHGDVTGLELDEGLDLASLEVQADGVVGADQRIGVADGAAVVGDDEGDTLGTNLHLANLAELILGLLIRDAVDNKAALNVVKDAEVLASLLNLDNIHEAGGVVGIGANLSIDLNQALHNDAVDLTLVQGVLETVADKHDEGKALTELVGASRRARGLIINEYKANR